MSSHDSVISSNRRSKWGRVQVSPTVDNTLSTVDVGIPAPVSSARSATSAPPKKRVRRGDPLDSLDPRSPSVPAPRESAYSLLPPVTVSHPSGVAYQQLCRRVSYGDLTPEEIVAILHQRHIAAADPRGLAPSPVATDPSFGIAPFTQAESANVDNDEGYCPILLLLLPYGLYSDSSECGNPFMDDIAEEKSTRNLRMRLVTMSLTLLSLVLLILSLVFPSLGPGSLTVMLTVFLLHFVHVFLHRHVRTKTTKGELASGLTEKLTFDDDIHNDPSVAITSKKLKHPHAVIPSASIDVPDMSSAPSAEVYLEDLGYPPVPVSRPSKKGCTR
ncbi:uncharacterized protein EV420DRAFT_1483039 [Desarmillaria tabescens]|uniref:Uncharacterized protein n=1 Tax=Armillaria tabescens TaxID=1929756 RepID=A0AA39JXV4_ARMTA|nr:uncharacterized protein EV420DRAFT_1483039 [Desarmillaria tabescens]KAK0449816.1 hypothetical protein EV420DRAFT_1483039 [Desarmillaria tabescens]